MMAACLDFRKLITVAIVPDSESDSDDSEPPAAAAAAPPLAAAGRKPPRARAPPDAAAAGAAGAPPAAPAVPYPGTLSLKQLHTIYSAADGTLPAWLVVEAEYRELRLRLLKAAETARYQMRWFRHEAAMCPFADSEEGETATTPSEGARCACTVHQRKPRSGIHVMKATDEELYTGLSGIMRIVDRACTTSSCEAYVEAIGSKLNTHASAIRGLDVKTYSMEAWIAWNSPALHRSDALLADALDEYFETRDWHFTKTSRHGMEHAAQLGFQSKVLHKMNTEASKFPFME
jgi:hypothetical protein